MLFFFSFHNIVRFNMINTDKFLRGMLQLRNTPDPDCKLSPAQILFGRPLRDAFSFINRRNKFENNSIAPVWSDAWKLKEEALRTRFVHPLEALGEKTRPLPVLGVGDRVFLQNQTGPHPTKWDRSGIIMEVKDNDQYVIKVDGTGRLTVRNRKFIKKYTLPQPVYHPISFGALAPSRINHGLAKKYSGDDNVVVPPVPLSCDTECSPSMPSATGETPSGEADIPSNSDTAVGPHHDCSAGDAVRADVESDIGASTPTIQMRPKRLCSAPKKYVPETGRWE